MHDNSVPDAPVVEAQEEGRESARGFLFAFGAFGLWGFMPLYMKMLDHVPAAEVVAHRALWSVPVAGALLLALGLTRDVTAALRSPRTLAMAAVTACVISLNWGVYVWAISADRALETALGYYINPLVSVMLGAVLLSERLNRHQIVAVGLAATAVLVLTVESGGLPWVSLVLAFSFAIYGFLRKTLPIGPSQGFFLEVAILSVPALFYLVWLASSGSGHFTLSRPGDMTLLLFAGPITAVPLILYAFGAKLLRVSTIGIMQYIAPTMIAMFAVFVFGEPFGAARLFAFGLIWAALVLYSWPMLFGRRPAPPPTGAL